MSSPQVGELITNDLKTRFEEYDFFEAVRQIESAVLESGVVRPRRGEDRLSFIDFKSLQSLAYPAGDIFGLKIVEQEDARKRPRIELTVTFTGLTGPSGALPRHYTAQVIERSHAGSQGHKDRAMLEFFDLFNRRAIALFYMAWEKYRFQFLYAAAAHRIDHDTPDDLGPGEDAGLPMIAYSLAGMHSPRARREAGFHPHAAIEFGGLFARHVRDATSLAQMLRAAFETSVEVIEFVGRWLELPESCQSRFEKKAPRRIPNCVLGETAVVGSRAWDQQGLIRLRVGPLKWDKFGRFLPAGDLLEAFVALAKTFVGNAIDLEVQLVLAEYEAPMSELGSADPVAMRLGWTTWLGDTSNLGMPSDTVLRNCYRL